jgi:hypothetical protein
MLYQAQDKYEEAELLLKRAVTISEQQLGMEHPQTQQMISNYLTLLSEIHTGGIWRLCFNCLHKESRTMTRMKGSLRKSRHNHVWCKNRPKHSFPIYR